MKLGEVDGIRDGELDGARLGMKLGEVEGIRDGEVDGAKLSDGFSLSLVGS